MNGPTSGPNDPLTSSFFTYTVGWWLQPGFLQLAIAMDEYDTRLHVAESRLDLNTEHAGESKRS